RWRDVEVQDVLARPELRVERDRRRVFVVGLDEDDVGAARDGDLLQLMDESRGDSFAPVGFGDTKIVDVDLAALLLEFMQLVRGDSADDLVSLGRGERDEGITLEQAAKVGLARRRATVGFPLAEHLP